MDYVENRMAQGQFPITYLLASANTPPEAAKPPSPEV
jgi:hypothetical protein